jgi:predicted AAA+ superfamily ATPase
MKRYLQDRIIDDLKIKMVFLTGPRQVGKTYLAKSMLAEFKNAIYLNNDDIDDTVIIRKRSWPLNSSLVVLDEIHKMKGWKNFIKGTFDTKGASQSFLVTGSARLDTFGRTGESLAGRYFMYRLNPLSVKELAGTIEPYEAVNLLNKLGGFPEPFLSGSEDHAARWRSQYFTDIVREDIMDYSRIHEIRAIKFMLEMLRKRVGSPVSFITLAQDLQIAPNTVRKYLGILESLHVIFTVRPFHKNIARAILKEPKVYFYDSGYVDGDEGIKLENTVAVCLLKHCQFLQDTKGTETGLNYIRTKSGQEIDFVVSDKGELKQMIEVKLSETKPSGSLKYFKERKPGIEAVQIVHNARNDQELNGIKIRRAGDWLLNLEA